MPYALILSVCILLVTAACGGSSSSGPSGAPIIVNLDVRTPTGLTLGRPATVLFLIQFHDPDGDFVPGGLCRFTNLLNGRELDLVLDRLNPGAPLNARDGVVSCGLTEPRYQARVIPIELRIADRAGHVSAPVKSTLILEAKGD